jgi:DDE domain
MIFARLQAAVLQLCRSGLICWADVPGILSFRSLQVAAIRAGGDPPGSGLYLRFSLSYRDVEELLAERGVHADLEVGAALRPIRVKGKWRYLYRAVDSSGATLDFLLSAKQDAA